MDREIEYEQSSRVQKENFTAVGGNRDPAEIPGPQKRVQRGVKAILKFQS